MASKVDIANFALVSIGAKKITSMTESVKEAQEINLRFDSIRDAVFRSHPWNCLISRGRMIICITLMALVYFRLKAKSF